MGGTFETNKGRSLNHFLSFRLSGRFSGNLRARARSKERSAKKWTNYFEEKRRNLAVTSSELHESWEEQIIEMKKEEEKAFERREKVGNLDTVNLSVIIIQEVPSLKQITNHCQSDLVDDINLSTSSFCTKFVIKRT